MHIPQRGIGRDGPLTGVLSLGSWHTYDRMDFREAVTMLRTAVDAGITLFDVGVYGFPGAAPVFTDVLFSAMVRAAGLKRDDYLLTAELWLEGYPQHALRGQLESALFRAGVEHADLVIVGDIRREDTDLHALVLDLAELRRAGLIRQWGVNNWSATNIRAVHDFARDEGVAGPAMAQLKHSVARRSIPDGRPFSDVFALGITLESSDVFEGGVLLGKTGESRQIGRDPGGVRDRITASAPRVAELANELDATAAQLCLGFTLTHPAHTTTLFGATSTEQLRDNLGAVELVERVGADELRALVEPLWADKEVVNPEGP